MKVYFSPKMVADSGSYSPSAGKPEQAVQSWMDLDLGLDIDIVVPQPVSLSQLYRAHDANYVDGVLSGRVSNGFGNRSKKVAKTLRHTSGAMLDAAREALLSGENTCAPVSGFHHACYHGGGGFCTFNGLMVTALDLIDSGDAKRVGILDCDQHYGNGTDDILRTLLVEADRIVHYTAGRSVHEAKNFLLNFENLILAYFQDCDVLLYQAGADPHIDDPLGGWMTTAQLHERDTIVFNTARDMGLPVAWDLAGGYSRDPDGGISKVLEIHDNTMRACLNNYP
jgi:acetoin utilization deacetylase AcuC-like enzyme